MTNQKHPSLDKDETISRLINENSQYNKMMQEMKYELSGVNIVNGLSFLSAIKTLIKKFHENEVELRRLQEKINLLNKKDSQKS